mmetsp:Transcript_80400/g.211156  ORF Transcript_80400/g.211156 Transcript_80400/m.211156 type:complete len:94 (+) Transcript_80400:405-686(+)
MEEAKRVLVECISHETLEGVPVLCFANKQDKSGALDVKEISRLFDFEQVLGHRPFHIHPCSALKAEGLEPGVRWLMAEAAKIKPRSEALWENG